MIIGLGIDIVDINRIRRSIDRFGRRFTDKILHESEIAALGSIHACTAQRIAARFAAKEAAVKALGTGFSQGIGLKDIRVLSLPSGKPCLAFYGKAVEHARRIGVSSSHLSLSHSRQSACAVAVLEGKCAGSGGEQLYE